MKLDAKLEIINNLASKNGYKKDPAASCQISLAKDSNSNNKYMIVTNSKKPLGDKFKLSNNVERIFCKFVHEGKATFILKEPPFTLAIQKYHIYLKADVNKLKQFIKLVSLAEKSPSEFDKELESGATDKKAKVQAEENFKKQITTLTIASSKEYDRNFRALISQNLRAQTQHGEINLLNLTKLSLKFCGLKKLHSVVLSGLVQLENLDVSENRLNGASLSGLNLKRLVSLNLSHNEIEYIPSDRIALPKLAVLDLSSNRLRRVGVEFWRAFSPASQITLNSNRIETFHEEFFARENMPNLIKFFASGNRLKNIPFSLAAIRLEVLELNENPFEMSLPTSTQTRLVNFNSQFPSLVELSARKVVDKRVKYKRGDIPATLIDYLRGYLRCHCGKTCFEHHLKEVTLYELRQIANTFVYVKVDQTTTDKLALLVTSCSQKCYNKFFRTRRH